MEKILISACLVGENTKYNGGNNQVDWIDHLSQYYDLVPFCPEVEGGLSIPRHPSEIKKSAVYNSKGKDVTSYFNKGAEKALNICRHAGIRLAILKENSPSCGVHSIYDGSFKGKTIKGSGITASLLAAMGIKVISNLEVETLLEELDYQKQKQIEGRLKNIENDRLKAEGKTIEHEEKKSAFKKERKFNSFKKRNNNFKKETTDQPESENKKRASFKKDRKFKPFNKDGHFSKNRNFKDKKFSNDKSSFKKDGLRSSFKHSGFKGKRNFNKKKEY